MEKPNFRKAAIEHFLALQPILLTVCSLSIFWIGVFWAHTLLENPAYSKITPAWLFSLYWFVFKCGYIVSMALAVLLSLRSGIPAMGLTMASVAMVVFGSMEEAMVPLGLAVAAIVLCVIAIFRDAWPKEMKCGRAQG